MKKFLRIGVRAFAAAGLATAAGLIIVPATLSNSAKTKLKTTSNATTYGYEPLSIKSGYNACTIATSSTESDTTGWKNVQALDDNNDRTNAEEMSALPRNYNNANLFTKSGLPSGKSGTGLPNPVDGYITLTSQYTPESSTEDLTWKIPASTTSKVNNCMKLYVNGSSSRKSGTFEFNDIGVYNKLYVLCTLAGSGVKSANIKITLNYTSGNPSTASYTIYDWFPGTSGEESEWQKMYSQNLIATTEYSRFWFYYTSGGSTTKNWNSGSGDKEVVFNQCPVEVDPKRIPTTLEIELDSTNDGDVLSVFGVTGQYASDVLAPVTIKTQKTKVDSTYHNYVTWQDNSTETTTPSFYYLDVFYYDGDNVVWSDYNNYKITREQAEASKTEEGKFQWEISNLTQDKKYWVQMRAGNESEVQSANSNIDYIYTDVGCPIKITCEVYEPSLTNSKHFDVKVNEASYLITQVLNDQTPQSVCLDQNVEWEIPTKYNGVIEISEATTYSTSSYKVWKVLSHKPMSMSTDMLKACAHADLEQNDEVNGDTTPNPVAPSVPTSTLANKQAKIQWTNPDIGTTKASENTFTLQVALETDTTYSNPVFSQNISYNTSGTTSNVVTGLKPDTKYRTRAKTDYNESSSNETISSDWSTDVIFTTTYNAANTLSLSTSSIQLMLGETDTTKDVTTTVKDSNGSNATYQEVTWTGDENYATVSSETAVQETATKHTFSPVKATTAAQTWTAKTKEKETVTGTVSISVGVSPTTVAEPTKVYPDKFTASWNAAKRADDTYWADGYVVYLYDANGTKIKEAKVSDPATTTVDFTDLTYNTKYSYSVFAVNNTVLSAESAKQTVTTETSYATKLTVYKDGAVFPDQSWINTLVGSKTVLTTEVSGETFDGTVYAASDQKVNSSGAVGKVSVVDSSDKTTHTVTAVTTGTDAFDLKTNITTRSPQTQLVHTTKIDVKPMDLGEIYDIDVNSFKVDWTNLSSYTTTPDKLSYVIEVATDDQFSTIVKTKTATSSATQAIVDGLNQDTTYYVRAKYVHNDVSSPYTTTQTITTDKAITQFSLNKSEITILGNSSDETLFSTTETPLETIPIEWDLTDNTICKVQEIQYSENGTEHHRFKITGLKTGTTILRVRPTEYTGFERECKIEVVKGTLDPVSARADKIQSHSFELLWDPITDWSGGSVNYTVNVWYETNGEKKYILRDFVTADTKLSLGSKQGIITNTKYYCSVEAFNDYYQTNEYNVVEVQLVYYSAWPWWKIVAVSGGSLAGLLFGLIPLLYVLWKYGIIRTIDPKKAKFKLADHKNNVIDKLFRVTDMYYVMWNQIVRKKFNTLFSKLGTNPEHKLDKKNKK